MYKTQDQIKAAGGKITKEAGALPGLGELSTDSFGLHFLTARKLEAKLSSPWRTVRSMQYHVPECTCAVPNLAL